MDVIKFKRIKCVYYKQGCKVEFSVTQYHRTVHTQPPFISL